MKVFKKLVRLTAFIALVATAITGSGYAALIAVTAAGIAVGIVIGERIDQK